jgi:hypothetical protein
MSTVKVDRELGITVEGCLSGISGTWPVPDLRYFWSLEILTPKEHSDKKDVLAHKVCMEYGM